MTDLATRPAPEAAKSSARRSRGGLVERFGFDSVILVLAATVLALIIYPLIKMVQKVGNPISSMGDLVSKSWFPGMVGDTVLVIGVSSALALVIGALLAWINERTDAGLGAAGDALPLIPLFLPAVALAVGWVVLASPEVGLLTDFMPFEIYSRPGIIMVYVLLTVPYAYLPIVSALRSIDPSMEEAARASGSGVFRVLRTVSLPIVAPALMSGFILAVVITTSVYSVPAIIAQQADLDILSVRIVRSIQNTYPSDYATAVQLAVLLFGVLVVLYYLQRLGLSKGKFAKVGGQASKVAQVPLGGWKWPLRSLLFIYIAFASALPMAAIAWLSFQKYWQSDLTASNWTLDNFSAVWTGSNGAPVALRNSILVGLGVAVAVVLVATLILTYLRQSNNWVAKSVNLIARFPAAVPVAVLGVSFIFAFAGAPFNLAGTLIIMGLAMFINFLPNALISLEATSAQIDSSLESAARLCGAGAGRTFWQIVVPLLRPGLFSTLSLVFVLVIGNLEIPVLLGTSNTPMVSSLLFRVWDNGSFTQVAAVALMMTVISGVLVVTSTWLSRPAWARRARAAQKAKRA